MPRLEFAWLPLKARRRRKLRHQQAIEVG